MSAQTEKALLDWENEERYVSDDLHIHFTEFGRWDWPEIADEARRIYNFMLNEDVEEDSLIDGLFAAVAAQAAQGVFEAVAAAIGVNAEALQYVVAMWYERQDAPPQSSVPCENLPQMCREREEHIMEQRKRDRDNLHDDSQSRLQGIYSERTLIRWISDVSPHKTANKIIGK